MATRRRRNTLRHRGHDYTAHGYYFVTVVTTGRRSIFGDVRDGEMNLNEWGAIVESCLQQIPHHFAMAQLDEHIVMPNHWHAIITIADTSAIDSSHNVGVRHAAPLRNRKPSRDDHNDPLPRKPESVPGSLSTIVGSVKSAVTRQINRERGTPGATVWQRDFHDHIVRDLESLSRIREYIRSNPANWSGDRENPANGSRRSRIVDRPIDAGNPGPPSP